MLHCNGSYPTVRDKETKDAFSGEGKRLEGEAADRTVKTSGRGLQQTVEQFFVSVLFCSNSEMPVFSAIAVNRGETTPERESTWLKMPFKEDEEQNREES